MEMQEGILGYAKLRRWNVQVIEHEPNRKSIKELISFWQPDGIIVEGCMDERGTLLSNVSSHVPVVYLMCNPKNLGGRALRIERDNKSLGNAAAKEFLSCGIMTFGYFGFTNLFWSVMRQEAFAEALKLNGHPVRVFVRDFFEGGDRTLDRSSRQKFVEWIRQLPKPCGILAANDMLAVELLNVCSSLGIDVPNEIAILGVDNDAVVCESVSPTLSSIRANFIEAGYQCAKLLDENITGTDAVSGSFKRAIPIEGIVRRQSTRRLPRADANVSKALEIIRQRACDGLLPRDVVSGLDCSRRLIELRFRELVGHSIGEEIHAVRMRRVKDLLLHGDSPIDLIAAQCGWKSAAQLRVAFHAQEGLSMREWRARCRNRSFVK